MYQKCDNSAKIGSFRSRIGRLSMQFTILFIVVSICCPWVISGQSEDQVIGEYIAKAKSYSSTNQDSAAFFFDLAYANIDEEKSDTLLGNLFYWHGDFLIEQGYYKRADSVLKLAFQIEEHTERMKKPERLGRLHFNQAQIHGRMNRVDEATASFEAALRSIKDVPESKQFEASIYNTRAGFFNSLGEMDKGAESQLQAIELYREIGDSSNLAIGYLNLSLVQSATGAIDQALESAQRAMVISNAIDDQRLSAYASQFIATTYSDQGNHQQALDFAQQSLESWKVINNPAQIGITLRIVGLIQKTLGDTVTSGKNIKASYEVLSALEDPVQLVYAEQLMGLHYCETGRPRLGVEFLEKAIEGAGALPDNYPLLRDSYLNLANAYEQIGNYRSAYDYRIKYEEVQDSIKKGERIKQIDELQATYELKEKELTIEMQKSELATTTARLNRNKWLIAGISVLGLSFLFLANLYFNLARKRKEVHDELLRLDQSKSQFFANISHELKTPLTLIQGPIDEALESTKNKFVEKQLRVAKRNSDRLLQLTNEILELSRLENDQVQLNNVSVQLHKLLERIIGSFESYCETHQINLLLENNIERASIVEMDVSKFEKVLQNLISNALKFSNPGDQVLVKAGMLNGKFVFDVIDQGPGIDPDEIEYLFTRYYQSKEGVVKGGAGIGLSLSYEIVKLMKGQLKAVSEKGQGSTFTCELPLKIVERVSLVGGVVGENQTEEAGVNDVLKKIQGHAKVLIVEDNAEMAEYIQDVLSPFYHCSKVSNGAEALTEMRGQDYDCITCDIMMPEMDGYSFVEKFREGEIGGRTPVIMISARSLEDDLIRGFDVGIDDYLVKPFRKRELLARVQNLIARKLEMQDAFQSHEVEEIELNVNEQFVLAAKNYILNHISVEGLKVEDLASNLNYSKRQLERKLKASVGLSPGHFIREVRLKRAFQLIKSGQFATIAEVRAEVGLSNASYFSKIFLERFGIRPGELIKN